MRKHYAWLWFDADGTLFDYSRAECVALEKSFQSLNAPFEDRYLDTYRRINQQLWQALERREISAAVLKVRRFESMIEELQLACSPSEMSAAYVDQLALCAELIEGAHEVLHALSPSCRFAIVTNGLETVQRSRLARSPIRHLIAEMIISEEVGSAKPEPAFFEAASARLGNPDKREVLMIGDSLSSDIRGGIDYGLDTCWFNPGAAARPDGLQITHEISHLSELLEVLE